MFGRYNAFTRRDAILLIVGAASLRFWDIIFPFNIPNSSSLGHESLNVKEPELLATIHTVTEKSVVTQTLEQVTATITKTVAQPGPTSHALRARDALPQTEVLAHAPGWTIFRNLYMSNGTLIAVADDEARKKFPPIRLMVSVSLEAINTPENIAAREPTQYVMDIIEPQEAARRWTSRVGDSGTRLNRVWTVEGNTVSIVFIYFSRFFGD